MRFRLQIDGAEHQIEAETDGALKIDGEALKARITSCADDRRTVQVGDESFEIRVIEDHADGGELLLELAGERIPVKVSGVLKGTTGAAAAVAGLAAAGQAPAATPAVAAAGNGGGTVAGALEEVKEGIWAPVPGKIVNVFVKPGDTLKEGDPVLVLEAMKMENELHAPNNGVVAAVLVRKGDQAERGQLLVAFE